LFFSDLEGFFLLSGFTSDLKLQVELFKTLYGFSAANSIFGKSIAKQNNTAVVFDNILIWNNLV